MSTGICINSPGCIARATVRHGCPHTFAQDARSHSAIGAHTCSSRAAKINYDLRVFRDDLAAAHSRIESLERELDEARSSQSAERVAELEAQLAALRRRRMGLAGGAIVLVAAAAFGVWLWFRSGDSCDDGDASACVERGLGIEASDPDGAEVAYAQGCKLRDGLACFDEGVMAYRNHKDRTHAVAAFRAGCELGHGGACANASAMIDDHVERMAFARKACELGRALGCSNVAEFLEEDKDYAGAMPFARQGCDKGSVGGCAALALALAMTGHGKEAVEAGTRAVAIDERHPVAHASLAHALVVTGSADDAIPHYKRAFALEHDATGVERPMFHEPLVVEVKRELAELAAVYPDRKAELERAALAATQTP
jgi:hypothetical protein